MRLFLLSFLLSLTLLLIGCGATTEVKVPPVIEGNPVEGTQSTSQHSPLLNETSNQPNE